MTKATRSTAEATPTVLPHPDSLTNAQRDRRRRIVLGALTLLEQGTYETVQVRDVALEAQVALGTVYRYFGSKEHLFAAVLVEWTEGLGRRLARRPLTGVDPAERIDAMMMQVLRAFERAPQFYGLVMAIDGTADPHARALYADFLAKTNASFSGALVGLAEADARDVLDVTNAVLAAALRSWTMGSIPIEAARRRVRRSIELIFSPPPGLPFL